MLAIGDSNWWTFLTIRQRPPPLVIIWKITIHGCSLNDKGSRFLGVTKVGNLPAMLYFPMLLQFFRWSLGFWSKTATCPICSQRTGRDGTGTGRDGTGRDGTGQDGTGQEGTGLRGTVRDETGRDGRDGTGRDGTGGDGTGWDGTGL